MSGAYTYTESLKTIHYGIGCLATALPESIDALGVKKGLIVTGRSLFSKTDVVTKVKHILEKHGAYAGVFTDIGEHSPVAGVNACIKVFKDTGADFIVALGGGSPIDAAKAVRYRIQEQTGAPLPPFQIAIPTTLSAAEYSVGAGYTDEAGVKVAVASQQLVPTVVILDAELTLPTPSRLWLSTGIRAVDHAVESLYRPLVVPPMKAMCYAALADLFTYLPACLADPTDVAARQKLLIAAWMSLWPMRREKYGALGLSHRLGHRLGATYGIPHGITSCLTLAPVVALKARTASPEDKECLANALFYLREPSTGSVEGDILRLSALISGLVEKLGLKSTLSEYKVPREDLSRIAAGEPDEVVELLASIY
ncbi:alcohol dehydrogenase IV [Mycena sp. CBHHK59/15]|nr:alcohol dehydrogenase IV [Mycena sp. CBHHK59/15]